MKKSILAAGAAMLALAPINAHAVTGNVIFNGTVTHTCTITVGGTAGSLDVDSGFQTLSSSIGSGSAGTATVVATGNGFDISVDTPSLSKPAEDTSSETLSASYSTTGASSVSGTDASAANDLNNGTTNVSVNMQAAKSGSDVFEAGAYTGTVVLRCE